MAYEITITYTTEHVRKAAWFYMKRHGRYDYVIALLAIATGIGSWLILTTVNSAVLVGVGLVLLLFNFFWGLAEVRISYAKFRAMKSPSILWHFGEDRFRACWELGTTEMKWEAITKMMRSSDFWLLFFVNGWDYSILPTASLPQEAQAFIISKVKASGGKIT